MRLHFLFYRSIEFMYYKKSRHKIFCITLSLYFLTAHKRPSARNPITDFFSRIWGPCFYKWSRHQLLLVNQLMLSPCRNKCSLTSADQCITANEDTTK
ncbi:A1 [Alcelaphine gammaherpesvirus 1]|uniref:Uncharacterized gene A1 protein n=1 Tax=Alcelaphine herpesvirus 1 (strain C500) TaxID=654901 RepID=VGA1_ALHV1|nr:A1 [Alcelaphine gammaherpesvirus 1]O36358.1 RecName: Full=Uncharacterized gene A1 protein [Alcelaphine herpesvirus 1 strain C500]AAC58052.1 A1 [Alcelaphine gammaherpesvirus 1]APB09501.1 protein A1 [Alcelaphine gammaherpesvirus 1]APB09573.1 protein A1 [Alcelaphine gammaherpesvirus 1]